MLTIFAVPKPFVGHIDVIQRNAIRSWLELTPACQIILCGDEEGTERVAREFGTDFLSGVARNSYGTPLLNSVFDAVRERARHDLLCYVNSDIIFLSDFPKSVARVRLESFLMVGQRWNVDLNSWDFASAGWENRLRDFVADHGTLAPPSGIDFLVFPKRSELGRLPPFAVGRPGWDLWFVYNARRRGIPVVDATPVVTAVHQNHDYRHVPDRRGESWNGPEGDQNIDLMGGPIYFFTISDATHILTPKGLQSAPRFSNFIIRFTELTFWMPMRIVFRAMRWRLSQLIHGGSVAKPH